MIMGLLQIALILSTFLCSLVAGFLFAFAVVAMPGIKNLSDREFIRAFQVMDRVIQNNQPMFMLVWVGSVLALIASALLGIGQLDGAMRWLLVLATLVYLFGVQLPTVAINIPLNNKIQNVDVTAADAAALAAARKDFEPQWNRWNSVRTVLASVVSLLLILLLIRA